MSAPLRATATALLLALAPAALPATAQEPGGDAPDGIEAAQPAYDTITISGDMEENGDVDCFALVIEDPALFSATTDSFGTEVGDTKLYLFEGDENGAGAGVVMNDDCPDGCPATGEGFLSDIPQGSLPGPNGAGPGAYVLCLTEFDVDPQNGLGEDVWPQDSPYDKVYYPAAPSGDYGLASWDVAGASDTGDYTIVLTGVRNTCDLRFLAADLGYDPDAQRLCATVTIRNDGSDPVDTALALDYDRDGSSPQGTLTCRHPACSGSLGAGVEVSRRLCLDIRGATPPGEYNLTLRLVDGAGTDCDLYQEALQISAPRTEGDGSGELFEVVAPADFSVAAALGAAVSVSPNPFARQTTLSFVVAEASGARLAIYDVLGREVAVLVDARVEAGTHRAVFDASGLAVGVYLWRLTVGAEVWTGRLTLAR